MFRFVIIKKKNAKKEITEKGSILAHFSLFFCQINFIAFTI